MTQAFVCIGSNMGDAQQHLAKARAALRSIPGVSISGESSLYRTEPQGRKDQPWFLNQVVRLDCENVVSAEGLLDAMLEKELELG
ncbi:MAG: 2-amino-4-hydroxy-6-hydroxymethyldihydropteridine diphosphokinase, partial [Mailhella sp.]|nr:2-amino-4-hydroxy-6-hydroxymethyldihydropteridine diphosphokinase [Mailhella sp.]